MVDILKSFLVVEDKSKSGGLSLSFHLIISKCLNTKNNSRKSIALIKIFINQFMIRTVFTLANNIAK